MVLVAIKLMALVCFGYLKMTKFLDYIDQVFKPDGILAELGGRYVKEQHDYALYIAKTIVHPEKAASYLQADTGIGKSFGYLIPAAIYIAMTPEFGDKKIIVSTYTRQLQKQILNEDVPFIREVLNKLGLDNNLVICYRMGRQAFFSPDRTTALCHALIAADNSRKDELLGFVDTVKDMCKDGSGLWADYIEEYGDLPADIAIDDICLLHRQTVDNEAFEYHLQRVKEASIVVSNHHSLILSKQTGLDKLDIHTIIFDEAHKCREICFDLFNYRTSISDFKRLLTHLEDYKELTVQVNASWSLLNQFEIDLKNYPRFNHVEFITETSDRKHFAVYKEQILSFSYLFSKLLSKFLNSIDSENLDIKLSTLARDAESAISSLARWEQPANEYTISAIGFSKIKRNISLATLNVFASGIFGVIMGKLADRIILTSATISDSRRELSFNNCQYSLGLRSTPVLFEASLSPQHYANMEFVLTQNDTPSPVLEFSEVETTFHPEWIKNTVLMIEAARKTGENVLVLTNSHTESKTIGILLKNQADICIHESGHALKEYIGDFKSGKCKTLVSCVAWEGLNVKKENGDQLISNVVMTRIPFTPPNSLIQFALKSGALLKGASNLAKNNALWVNQQDDVIAKMKQGFGRGTRGPDHSVKIWIADSRMPHNRNVKGNSALLNAIPSRFMNNFLNAEIFLQKKKEVFLI